MKIKKNSLGISFNFACVGREKTLKCPPPLGTHTQKIFSPK